MRVNIADTTDDDGADIEDQVAIPLSEVEDIFYLLCDMRDHFLRTTRSINDNKMVDLNILDKFSVGFYDTLENTTLNMLQYHLTAYQNSRFVDDGDE